MSKLIYITNASLDGYIEDKTGAFDWGNPDQVRRRMSPVSPSGDRRRRKAGIPNRHTTESRIARHATFRHRSNPLALSHAGRYR
jgi:hypothetical protein